MNAMNSAHLILLFVCISVGRAQGTDWHFTPPNIALHKHATQWPGDFEDSYASRAVDGNNNSYLESKSCSHTSNGNNGAYWKVDLEQSFYIKGIRIFNRHFVLVDNSTGVSQRLKNFTIVGKPGDFKLYDDSQPQQYEKPIIDIQLTSTRPYQSIYINIPHHVGFPDAGMSYLTLCEVEIFAILCDAIDINQYKHLQGTLRQDTGFVYRGKYNSYGSVIDFNCDPVSGLHLVGSQSITCLYNGDYSRPVPECKRRCDERPPIENGNYLHNTLFHSGDKADWTCTPNYYTASNNSIICNSNGQWQKPYPTCIPIQCPFPIMTGLNIDHYRYRNNSRYVNGNLNAGKYVQVFCKNGYKPVSKTLNCTDKRTWIPNLNDLCTVILCTGINLYNAILKYSTGYSLNDLYAYGTSVIVTCKPGFRLSVAKPKFICGQDEKWDSASVTCLETCITPAVQHGRYVDDIGGSEKVYNKGRKLHLKCDSGYRIEQTKNSTFIMCDKTHMWNGHLFNCTAITCSIRNLQAERNFYVLHLSNDNRSYIQYNHSITSICQQGYERSIGDHTRQCLFDGSLSGLELECIGSTSSTSNLVSSIGGGIGGIVALAFIILVVVIIFKRRSIPERKSEQRSPTLSSITANNQQNTVVYSNIHNIDKESRTDTVDDTAYYSFTNPLKLPERGIKLEDLADFVLAADTANDKYKKEFKGFPEGMKKSHDAALANRGKNRYRNLYAYDESRVVLDIWKPDSETDYINANYIHGFDLPKAYIASQGITSENINDFWRMVWQTNCGKIVMLTNIMEEEKVKCEQYWPDTGTEIYGSISVTAKHTEVFSNFVIRSFSVYRDGEKKRHVLQFHFTAWPDQGVPKYCSALVHFRNKVKTTHSASQGPIVVHCSAGIGRTGTYIALDYLTDQGRALGVVDVPGCVETLRRQRVNMVQTKDQYILVHQSLVETLMLSTSALTTQEFPNAYRKLKTINHDKGQRNIDIEFQMIGNMSPVTDANQYATAKDVPHRLKNRYSNILPAKDYMPSIFEPGHSDCGGYINAVFLPSYKKRDALIITQTPLETTKQDFWKMVFHQNIHTIVMMNHESEMMGSEIYWPLENEKVEEGDFTIDQSNTDLQKGHILMTITLEFQNKPRTIRLLQFGAWPGSALLPESPNTMLSALDMVMDWQRNTGNNPVLVHCMNGAEKSGLFCVLYALLERTKIEHDVAISQVIQEMRNRRQQIIPNVNQFEYCHDVVSEYLKQFETYSNFTDI